MVHPCLTQCKHSVSKNKPYQNISTLHNRLTRKISCQLHRLDPMDHSDPFCILSQQNFIDLPIFLYPMGCPGTLF